MARSLHRPKRALKSFLVFAFPTPVHILTYITESPDECPDTHRTPARHGRRGAVDGAGRHLLPLPLRIAIRPGPTFRRRPLCKRRRDPHRRPRRSRRHDHPEHVRLRLRLRRGPERPVDHQRPRLQQRLHLHHRLPQRRKASHPVDPRPGDRGRGVRSAPLLGRKRLAFLHASQRRRRHQPQQGLLQPPHRRKHDLGRAQHREHRRPGAGSRTPQLEHQVRRDPRRRRWYLCIRGHALGRRAHLRTDLLPLQRRLERDGPRRGHRLV